MAKFYEIISPTGQKNYLYGTLHTGHIDVNCLPKEGLTVFVNTGVLCSRSARSGDGNNIKGLSGMFLLLPDFYVQ